jgi:hypothetical protein
MIPIWFWKMFGVRKLVPGEPLKHPITDLSAVASYQNDLTQYQNRQAQNNNRDNAQQNQINYASSLVSTPLWRI